MSLVYNNKVPSSFVERVLSKTKNDDKEDIPRSKKHAIESWVSSWPYYVPLPFFQHVLFLGVLQHIYKAFVLGEEHGREKHLYQILCSISFLM